VKISMSSELMHLDDEGIALCDENVTGDY